MPSTWKLIFRVGVAFLGIHFFCFKLRFFLGFLEVLFLYDENELMRTQVRTLTFFVLITIFVSGCDGAIKDYLDNRDDGVGNSPSTPPALSGKDERPYFQISSGVHHGRSSSGFSMNFRTIQNLQQMKSSSEGYSAEFSISKQTLSE